MHTLPVVWLLFVAFMSVWEFPYEALHFCTGGKGATCNPQSTKANSEVRGGSIMLWGCFAVEGTCTSHTI